MIRTQDLDLNNIQKAAIVLALIGPKSAGLVLKHMSEDQVEAITLEMARLDRVNSTVRNHVVDEFHELCLAQDYIAEGGLENARRILVEAYGEDKGGEIIKKITSAMQILPFEFLKKTDPSQLLGFIQDEHPQTIALILSYLPASVAADVMIKLNPDLRCEVAERIGAMDQTPPEVIRRVESVLRKKMSSVLNEEITKAGGPQSLVDILQRVDRKTERIILDGLTDNNPDLADDVKSMMFVFEDILQLDDRAVQAVLKEVDAKELAMALKNVSDEVKRKIFTNMSDRAASLLQEDMEYMGPVKLKSVEESQQRIVAVIRRLEEAGEISIGRGEEDVLI